MYKVYKKTLKNGLTALINPTKNHDRISITMWYKVGSKNENDGIRGYAHLLEHMTFKGSKNLSETDLIETIYRLGGLCNAFTTQDYTCYKFELPHPQWYECLPLLAETMVNCTFKQDYLNSELKAVIEELKKDQDNNSEFLESQLTSLIFDQQPYHYPVIGIIENIIKANTQQLMNFYKKYYFPANATLLIVGNIEIKEALSYIENAFNQIKTNKQKLVSKTLLTYEQTSKQLKLFKDIQTSQIEVIVAFKIPGLNDLDHEFFKVMAQLLFENCSSPLYIKLVQELEFVTDLSAKTINLFEQDLFIISFNPTDTIKTPFIINLINAEFENLIRNGISEKDINQFINHQKVNHYSLMYDNKKLAEKIGTYFLALNNKNYIFEKKYTNLTEFNHRLKLLLKKYYHLHFLNKGFLLPIPSEERVESLKLMSKEDTQEDKELNKIYRKSDCEPLRYSKGVYFKNVPIPKIPSFRHFSLKNGLKIIYYKSKISPLITCEVKLACNNGYEPNQQLGIYHFLINQMFEGSTIHNSALDITRKWEQWGTQLDFSHETIRLTMLNEYFEENLYLLVEILSKPLFDANEIEKTRKKIILEIETCANDSNKCSEVLVKHQLYESDPRSRNILGTKDTVSKISKKDLIHFYQKYISPKGAQIALTGNMKHSSESLIKKVFDCWNGPKLPKLSMRLAHFLSEKRSQPLYKDQMRLTYASLTLKDNDTLYPALEVLEEILTGDMKGKLFQIREKTGLFYSIEASLTKSLGDKKRYFSISTLIYKEDFTKFDHAVKHVLNACMTTLTQTDLDLAKNMVCTSFAYKFNAPKDIIKTLFGLQQTNFKNDYWQKKAEDIQRVTLAQVKKVAKRIFHKKNMIIIKI